MKSMLKRLAVGSLSLVMLLGLVGCGGGSEETPAPDPAGSAAMEEGPKTYKVGFSNVWVGNSWGVQCVNELESYLKSDPRVGEYYITDANAHVR